MFAAYVKVIFLSSGYHRLIPIKPEQILNLGGRCCIFRSAFGCCALQTLVEIVFFCKKSLKKHQNACRLFYSQKSVILKKFAANFLLFCIKNFENDFFDQRLECTAPKRWSKYTTGRYNQTYKTLLWTSKDQPCQGQISMNEFYELTGLV